MNKIILLLLVLFCFKSFSQNRVINPRSASQNRGDTISVLKQISLCKCIFNGFPSDSLESKDPSIYVLMESINCSYDLLDSIDDYTKKILDSLPVTRKGQNRENTYNRRIVTGCLNMYLSKHLDLYLKKISIKFYK